MMKKYFMWKKFNIYLIERTKNYFHITSTNSSNFNQSKILSFFHDFSHFKLNPTPTQDKFLDFLQHDFSKLNLLQKALFFHNLLAIKKVFIWNSAHTSIPWKKLFEEDLALKNHVAKNHVILLKILNEIFNHHW